MYVSLGRGKINWTRPPICRVVSLSAGDPLQNVKSPGQEGAAQMDESARASEPHAGYAGVFGFLGGKKTEREKKVSPKTIRYSSSHPTQNMDLLISSSSTSGFGHFNASFQ